MTPATWLAAVDVMVARLDALHAHIHGGRSTEGKSMPELLAMINSHVMPDGRDSVTGLQHVSNAEIRSLDLVGLDILRRHLDSTNPLISEWRVHDYEMNEFRHPITKSIEWLRRNQQVMRSVACSTG